MMILLGIYVNGLLIAGLLSYEAGAYFELGMRERIVASLFWPLTVGLWIYYRIRELFRQIL